MILAGFGMTAHSGADTTCVIHIIKGPEYLPGDDNLSMELKRSIVHFGTPSLQVDFIVNTGGTTSDFFLERSLPEGCRRDVVEQFC
jgi:hypothetical protein